MDLMRLWGLVAMALSYEVGITCGRVNAFLLAFPMLEIFICNYVDRIHKRKFHHLSRARDMSTATAEKAIKGGKTPMKYSMFLALLQPRSHMYTCK